MSQAAWEQRWEESLGKALKRPMYKMAYPNGAALVEKRLQDLRRFMSLRFSQDMRGTAEQAINLTRSAHQICEGLRAAANEIAEFPKWSVPELWTFAKQKMDEQEPELIKSGIPADSLDDTRQVRTEVLSLLVKAITAGDEEKTLREVLNEGFGTDGTDFRRQNAFLQAQLLDSHRKLIVTQLEMLQSTALLGLIWRGLFYYCVIDDQGGSFERRMSRQEAGEVMAKVIPQLLAIVPGMGAIFKAYELGKTLLEFRDAAHRVHVDELEKRIGDAEEYVTTYAKVLCGWCTAALAVKADISSTVDRLFGPAQTRHAAAGANAEDSATDLATTMNIPQ
jgi:hypothetical protein